MSCLKDDFSAFTVRHDNYDSLLAFLLGHAVYPNTIECSVM